VQPAASEKPWPADAVWPAVASSPSSLRVVRPGSAFVDDCGGSWSTGFQIGLRLQTSAVSENADGRADFPAPDATVRWGDAGRVAARLAPCDLRARFRCAQMVNCSTGGGPERCRPAPQDDLPPCC